MKSGDILKFVLKLIVVVAFLWGFIYVNNQWIVTSEYTYEHEMIPDAFDGYRIVQVSDLHDATFGEKQAKLIEKVKETNPDIILITGDIIDSNRYDLDNSLEAVREFVKLADVYYVTGNHEVATNLVDEIYAALQAEGVKTLANDAAILEKDGEQLALVGIEDHLMGYSTAQMLATAEADLPETMPRIYMAHRPEMFDEYVAGGVTIVFTGHAHGGQVRLPFVGGLWAPGQGQLPTYTSGLYEKENTTMVVSRGLGNSTMPLRVFNLPEIVVVELKK